MTARANSNRVEAYERFCACLRGAQLRPGQFVSQRELAVPKRGLQIAPVDLRLIRNAFQVRAMIEREAIAHFTQVVSTSELDDAAAATAALLHHIGCSRQRVVDASFHP